MPQGQNSSQKKKVPTDKIILKIFSDLRKKKYNSLSSSRNSGGTLTGSTSPDTGSHPVTSLNICRAQVHFKMVEGM